MKKDTKPNANELQQKSELADALTDSWIAFFRSPDDEKTRNRFACELNTLVRKFLSRASQSELLRSLSEDLRQEANLLLITKLLAGNRELIAASRAGDHTMIAGQLRRSVSAAIRFSRWKLFKEIGRIPGEVQTEQAEAEVATYEHPANIRKLSDLPLEAQQKVVIDMLRHASIDLFLTPGNAELASQLIKNNLTQADLARSLGVSRQAVYQRLDPVWRYLRSAIEEQEFPLS